MPGITSLIYFKLGLSILIEHVGRKYLQKYAVFIIGLKKFNQLSPLKYMQQLVM